MNNEKQNLEQVQKEHPVILFDGVCNYCNGVVNFLIKRDKKSLFRFAPLQGEAGQAFRQQYQIPETVDSFVYIVDGKAHIYSTGVLMVTKKMPGLWPAFSAFLIVPRFIRDGIYKWIARNRYKWFGSKETCMVPTPDVRARYLM